MKVSIITVVRNRVDSIRNTIQSVLSQDYTNIEYLVIDGNSTDGTIDVINAYSSKIDVFLSENDNSIYEALNKGIKHAKGDIIGVLHADDVFSNNSVISNVVDSFNSDLNTSLLYGDADYVNSKNIIVRHYSSKFFRPFMFYFGFQPAHTASFIRKTCYEAVGNYREDLKIAGDFELLLRVMSINKFKFKYLPLTMVNMRIGGISSSGISSVIRLNREVIFSLKSNNLFASIILVYSKYIFKIWSFLISK
jgi:glycosyltransferase involved in cell wall biosynthesis